MYMTIKRFFYLGLPTLFVALLYISNFPFLVKLIGIAIMLVFFLVAIIVFEVYSVIKKSNNSTKREPEELLAFICLVLFMLGFFVALFLELLNLQEIIVLEISGIFFLMYMILEVYITINDRVIKNKKAVNGNSNDSCKLVLLVLSSVVLLWFFRSDIFTHLHSELIILKRNVLIVFANFLLLAFCVNLICAFSSQNNKKILAMKLFFVSLLLIFTSTISLFIWFDKDIANGVIVFLAGIMGGMLTLLGVLLSLRREDQIRKYDEKIKSKPYLVLIQNSNIVDPSVKRIKVTDLEIKDNFLSSFVIAREDDSSIIINNSNVKNIFSFEQCVIKNSENAICVVKGIEIDNIFMELKKPFLLDKNEIFCLFGKDIWFSIKKENFIASIIVADTNGNNYSINLELVVKTESIQRKESTQLLVSVGTVFAINEIGLSFDYVKMLGSKGQF